MSDFLEQLNRRLRRKQAEEPIRGSVESEETDSPEPRCAGIAGLCHPVAGRRAAGTTGLAALVADPPALLLWPLAGLLLLPWFLALYWTQYNAASETARGRALPGSWPFALSGALFTGWLLLTVFPLQ